MGVATASGPKPKRRPPIVVGQRFGRLTTLEKIQKGNGGTWSCVCDCGKSKTTRAHNLTAGYTLSCGCLRAEVILAQTKHGMESSSEYRAWVNMKDRCNRKASGNFPLYGGRGIKVCERWMRFENFWEDMGPRPHGLTLERKDNSRGYSPDNCCWATRTAQQRNRRACRYLTINGETRCVTEWSEISGVMRATINQRLRRGIGPRSAVFNPVNQSKSFRKTK